MKLFQKAWRLEKLESRNSVACPWIPDQAKNDKNRKSQLAGFAVPPIACGGDTYANDEHIIRKSIRE